MKGVPGGAMTYTCFAPGHRFRTMDCTIRIAIWKQDRDFIFENGDRFFRKNRGSV